MLHDSAATDLTTPVSSQTGFPPACLVQGGLDSVLGPMNLPLGISAGSDTTLLNDGSFLLAGNTTDTSSVPVLIDFNSDGQVDPNIPSTTITPGYLLTTDPLPVVDPTQVDGGVGWWNSGYSGTTDSLTIVIDPVDIVDPLPIVDPVPEFPVTEGGNDGNSSLTTPDGYSLDGGVQVLMDGTSLASGFSSDGSKTPVLVNYNADGSINTSFGINGTITGNPGTDFQYAYEDSNSGRIVSTQYAYQADGSLSAVVTYYTTSGQLDPSQSPFANSFNQTEGGNDGNSSLTAPDGYSLDGGVQVLMDGTSLASGFSSDGSKTPVLVNYNADGSINSSFGNNGIIIGTLGTDYQYTYQDSNSGEIVFKQFANQADGSITEFDNFYTATGQLDESNPPFATTIIPSPTPPTGGVDPIVVIDPIIITDPIPVYPPICVGSPSLDGGLIAPDGSSLDGGYQVLQDGTSLASGWSTDGANTPVLVDYNADGSINTAFGNNGELSGPAGATWLSANQTDAGTIQIQGSVSNADGSYSSFLEQFTSTGQVDTSFGAGSGSLTAPEGLVFNGNFTTLSDGDILAASITTDGNYTPVIVDYTSAGVINPNFGTNGEIVAPAGVSNEFFYQDSNSGDILVTDSTSQNNGSFMNQSTDYDQSGQVDKNISGTSYTIERIYFSDKSTTVTNFGVVPAVIMDGGIPTVHETKITAINLENSGSTYPVTTSQPTAHDLDITAADASSLTVTSTFYPSYMAAAVISVSSSGSTPFISTVSTSNPLPNTGTRATVIVQSGYDMTSSVALASISALKLADNSQQARNSRSSQDENFDFSTSQDTTPFQIKQDAFDSTETPQPEDMTIPASGEADLPDKQEEGENKMAAVAQQNTPTLLARNNLVTTISLDLPDFMR